MPHLTVSRVTHSLTMSISHCSWSIRGSNEQASTVFIAVTYIVGNPSAPPPLPSHPIASPFFTTLKPHESTQK